MQNTTPSYILHNPTAAKYFPQQTHIGYIYVIKNWEKIYCFILSKVWKI